MLNILPLLAFTDNYIWVIHNTDNNKVAIVDPGTAEPVKNFLNQNSLKLSCILTTHHHWDHTGGVAELIKEYKVPVFGPSGKDLAENEQITLPDQNITLTAIHIPGHTLDHVAYYNHDMLFSGDTLFAAGCGRVFEGTHAQMFNSLQKLKQLAEPNPKNLKLYCGHEYTVKNLQFALTLEPDNNAIQQRLAACEKLRAQNQPTLPASMAEELATNPFLRVNDLDDFIKIRNLKDKF